ncbi:MAG: PIN domain-containing protein [Pseudomonadota bacterium]
MSRGVLLDTNLIIQAFDHAGTSDPATRDAAKTRMNALLSDPEVMLAITPLIRYEVLRGIPAVDATRVQELSAVLTQFETYEIRSVEANLAAELWRYAVSKDQKPNKRSFDIAHVASAKANNLEMTSADVDISKLQSLYDEMKKETK